MSNFSQALPKEFEIVDKIYQNEIEDVESRLKE